MAAGPTIVAKFLADTSKMTDEVDKATTNAGNKFGDFAKKAAFAVGGAFAVDKVIDFAKASVEAAAADAEAQDKLALTMRNVTGATDDQIAASEAFIGNLSKQAALADDDLRPAMDKLVRGFGNAEKAQSALALATDVSAGTGKDLSTVTDAMMKAAMGNTGALKKMGVEVENADGSAKSLDQVMADMSKTFSGQAATAAQGTAGQMRNAQIQFGEFQEQVGTALLPVLATLAGFLIDTLIPALSGIATWMADNKDVLIAGFIGLAVIVGAVVVPAFITWATAAGAAAIATLTAIAPFILIGALIAGIAYLIIKNWDNIKAGLGVVWEFIQNVFGWIVTAVTTYLGFVVTFWTTAWNVLVAVVTTLWDWIKTVFGWIVTGIQLYIGLVIAFWTTAWNVLLAVVTTLWDWISTVFGWIVTGIETYVGLVIGFWTTAWDVLKAVVTTLWDWIKTVFGWIVTGITTYVNTWVSIVTGAWDLIKNGATAVWQWIVDKFNAIVSVVTGAANTVRDTVTGAWNAIKDGVSAVYTFVTDKFTAIADFFQRVIDRIKSMAGGIADAVKGPINSVLNFWNGLEFRIPEMRIPEVEIPIIGKVGGGTMGGQRFETNNIPLLARGGVLTDPTLFVGGEAGTEIVAPEDMLRAIVAEEGGGGTYILNMYPRTADASDIAYGFRRLELLAGLP
jgi:phage-related protein